MIATVGEYACAAKLQSEIGSGALTSATAFGVCNAAASQLVNGGIDPSALGLSAFSGFLDGVGNSMLEDDNMFGVLFKVASVSVTGSSLLSCMDTAERNCR